MNRIVERLYRRIGLEFILRWRKLGLLYLVKVGRLLGLNWMLRLCFLDFWKRQLHGVVLATAVVSAGREVWGAVVAHVPFVDVLSTMLDGELPLTPGEWPDWGNPLTHTAALHYIPSLSPYDTTASQPPSHVLLTAAITTAPPTHTPSCHTSLPLPRPLTLSHRLT